MPSVNDININYDDSRLPSRLKICKLIIPPRLAAIELVCSSSVTSPNLFIVSLNLLFFPGANTVSSSSKLYLFSFLSFLFAMSYHLIYYHIIPTYTPLQRRSFKFTTTAAAIELLRPSQPCLLSQFWWRISNCFLSFFIHEKNIWTPFCIVCIAGHDWRTLFIFAA